MSDPVEPLRAVMTRRRMCRDFSPEALAPGQLERLLGLARRAPSAGFTQGVAFVSLERPDGAISGSTDPVASYWDLTLPAPRRTDFAWPGLLLAPVLVTLWVRPQAWVERYGRDDKARAHLGDDQESWPVPYWWVDAGAVVQNLLLAAEAEGLGCSSACSITSHRSPRSWQYPPAGGAWARWRSDIALPTADVHRRRLVWVVRR